jgi:hypothetical protein
MSFQCTADDLSTISLFTLSIKSWGTPEISTDFWEEELIRDGQLSALTLGTKRGCQTKPVLFKESSNLT